MNKGILLTLSFMGAVFLTCNSVKETRQSRMENDTRWSQVDSLEEKGLFRSAWDKTDDIYADAVTRGDYQTQYKALCYQLKYAGKVEDGSELDAIPKLREVANSAQMPLSAIAHSMTAEAYWSYYQQHRWEIIQRTPAVGVEDIRYWDLSRFVDEIDAHFSSSLVRLEYLKEIQIKDLDPELVNDTGAVELRPSLYELLAHRALDFYKRTDSGLTRPKDFFQINSEQYYSSGEEFAAMIVPNTDTLSFNYRAIRIFQDLLSIQEVGSPSWLSTDLERLQFISSKSDLPDKKGDVRDIHLLEALESALKERSSDPIMGEYALTKARLYTESASEYSFGKQEVKKEHYLIAEGICEEVRSLYPESRSALMAVNLLSDIRQKSLQVLMEEVMIPERSNLVKVDYRNINDVSFRVVEVDYDFMQNERYDQDKYVRQLCKQPMRSEWSLNLRESEDHHSHSIESKIPALSPGHYAIIASSGEEFENEDAKAYSLFWVTHIAMQEGPKPDGGSSLILKNRDTGDVLPGAEVIHYAVDFERNSRKRNLIELGRYPTDSNGSVSIPYERERYSQALDIVWNKELYHTGFYSRNPHQSEREYESTQFFLDRSIYRPGQTLYLKGIHMKNGSEGPSIKTGTKVEVTLRDANYQEVSKQTFTSNEFGSFNGTFSLPSSGLTGQMTLQSQYGSAQFSVEEYKRPKFKVALDTIEGTYSLGSRVKIAGEAMAYNGAPNIDAQVRYSVQRKPIFKWRWGWWYRMPYFDQSPVQVATGTSQSDDQGRFEFEFEAVEGNESGGDDFSHYLFEIAVEVTDINGETRETSGSINIGDVALLLDSDIPAEISSNKLPEIQVKSTNLNGKHVDASGQWEILKVLRDEREKTDRRWDFTEFQGISKEDFQRELGLFYFNEEEEVPDTTGQYISSGEWNTAVSSQLSPSDLESLESGEYLLKLKSAGPEQVEMTKRFLIYEPKEGISVFKEPLKIIDTSAPYLPGQKAEFLISSSWADMMVHIEYEHDKKIFKTEDIQLNKGQKIISFPILKEYQEGVFIHISALKNNRIYAETVSIEVIPIDRLLDVNLETYRDKMLPGSEEQWRLKVKAKNGDQAISELLLSMYDASLDQFKMHTWSFNPWSQGYPTMGMDFRAFGTAYSRLYSPQWYSRSAYVTPLKYPTLNRFGYVPQFYSYFGRGDVLESVAISSSRGGIRKRGEGSANEPADMAFDASEVEAVTIEDDSDQSPPSSAESPDAKANDLDPQVRKDFKETAFFYPDLRTDADGGLVFSFTMPESLTTWKFQALAHSKKLQSGTMTKEIVTQKDLMVVPNSPRFLRENDKMTFSSKLVSLSDQPESGSIRLELLNSMTMEDISGKLIKSPQSLSFDLDSKESDAFEWKVNVPKDYQAITYRFIAEGTDHSDGEEDALPVLSNRMLVTESMPFVIMKEDEKKFDFIRMNEVNSSNSLEPHALTLEFTANPIWYAVQAMPYMMEYPYDCSEQIFTRFYANSLASDIIEDRPRIREVINTWKDFSPDSFLSNLEKNQELKYVLLEETPWVMEAKNESERKKRLSLLLDVNHMAERQGKALDKLIRTQDPSGGWPWFAGMRPNLYITQYILSGLGHLKHLGILDETDPRVVQMIENALRYLDDEHLERWRRMKRFDADWKSNDRTGPFEIQYLYARTFYQDKGLPTNEAFEFYKGQMAEYWLKKSIYMQGMSALALYRLEDEQVARDILKSVKEQAMMDDELGMYWKNQNNGWYWYEAGIERHALMVEAFSEVMNDEEAVYGLKQWLIFNKQTNDWETTRATAEACYALLLGGNDWTEDRTWTLEIGSEQFDSADPALQSEAGTGYLKKRWDGNDIRPDMSRIGVRKEGEAPAWGAVYYQYFETLEKITESDSPLKVRKDVFKVKRADTGEELVELNDGSVLTVGDRVRVRMEVETDREMEFVHIKDMRSAGMEPVDVLSQVVYSGGLGFYRNTRDAATNFFIDDLRKGAYVLEYDVFVSHKGDFSNGITTIQCMYAPEFTSHSEGIRVIVE